MKNLRFLTGRSSGCGDSMVLCRVLVLRFPRMRPIRPVASTRFHVATAGDRRNSVIQPTSRRALFVPYTSNCASPRLRKHMHLLRR